MGEEEEKEKRGGKNEVWMGGWVDGRGYDPLTDVSLPHSLLLCSPAIMSRNWGEKKEEGEGREGKYSPSSS